MRFRRRTIGCMSDARLDDHLVDQRLPIIQHRWQFAQKRCFRSATTSAVATAVVAVAAAVVAVVVVGTRLDRAADSATTTTAAAATAASTATAGATRHHGRVFVRSNRDASRRNTCCNIP